MGAFSIPFGAVGAAKGAQQPISIPFSEVDGQRPDAPSAAAGGSWTPDLAQTLAQSNFARTHPTLAAIAEPAANAMSSAGHELLSQGIRAVKYVSPRGGAAIERAIPQSIQGPVQGPGAGTGRALADIGEFFIPGLGEEEGAVDAATGLPVIAKGLARVGEFAGQVAHGALGAGAVTALQGGNPTSGAIIGGAAPIVGAGMKAIAPPLLRSAMGLGAKDMQYGIDPAREIATLPGLLPSKVAASARGRLDELVPEMEQEVKNASESRTSPAVLGRAPVRLGLPPGPPIMAEPELLHEAQAVVERPSGLQPAAEATTSYPGPSPARPELPEYTNAPAYAHIPPPTWRNEAEKRAADFLDRLRTEGGGGVTYPEGYMPEDVVNHPLSEPLRTTRGVETAQGVRLRPVEPAPVTATPEQRLLASGINVTPPQDVTTRGTIQSALRRVADYARDAGETLGGKNSPARLKLARSIEDQLTKGAETGAPLPAERTPWELLQTKRGIGDTITKWDQGDQKIGAGLKKGVYGDIDREVDRLVPGHAEKNARIASLIRVANPRGGARLANSVGTGVLRGAGIPLMVRTLAPHALPLVQLADMLGLEGATTGASKLMLGKALWNAPGIAKAVAPFILGANTAATRKK